MITRDVITDLMPLYLAGECSEDTRQLVDEYLRDHPELKEHAERVAEATSLLRNSPHQASAEAEKRALQRVRRLIRYRNGALGAAIAYSLLPFSFAYSEGKIHWLVLNNPDIRMQFFSLATVFWLVYFYFRFQARKSGI